jgi:hypothetical protein
MSAPILICTIGSAKKSPIASGVVAKNSATSAWNFPSLGLAEKSRSGLWGKRGIGPPPFSPRWCKHFVSQTFPIAFALCRFHIGAQFLVTFLSRVVGNNACSGLLVCI